MPEVIAHGMNKINIQEKEHNMAKFGYQSTRKMDPKLGRTYATEYYKQSKGERARTEQHVRNTIQQVGDRAAENNSWDALKEPMKRFQRRETKGAYTPLDVMGDLLDQLEAGKDIPSGMLGRWNRMFDGTGCEIDMVPESELPDSNLFREVFQEC